MRALVALSFAAAAAASQEDTVKGLESLARSNAALGELNNITIEASGKADEIIAAQAVVINQLREEVKVSKDKAAKCSLGTEKMQAREDARGTSGTDSANCTSLDNLVDELRCRTHTALDKELQPLISKVRDGLNADTTNVVIMECTWFNASKRNLLLTSGYWAREYMLRKLGDLADDAVAFQRWNNRSKDDWSSTGDAPLCVAVLRPEIAVRQFLEQAADRADDGRFDAGKIFSVPWHLPPVRLAGELNWTRVQQLLVPRLANAVRSEQ
eukprot:TRINITY_DN11859_c0_g1_i2.p1 TRINITY_DN11859_c0_g1~~TRINITY_DN11859_c0_g1_i2.p1  ORF type:complete len:296 (+),score=78.56 TRINITY_DN11859_c0_g1_i2:80-889(+)